MRNSFNPMIKSDPLYVKLPLRLVNVLFSNSHPYEIFFFYFIHLILNHNKKIHSGKVSLFAIFFHLDITRNCSKLRKIHSGQGPISLTINPSEFKFFGQFALLWFKFSWCQLMSLQFLHMTSMTRDPSTSIPVYCQGMRKICSDDQKMKYDKMKF